MSNSKSHILIAYFSRKGQNYVNGSIIDLKQGNTAVVAGLASDMLGADSFEIEPIKAYPDNYHECTLVAKDELRVNSRPLLIRNMDISVYDTIILGYPNWWGTMPMAVRTFLDSHDFSGKTILPFCTHEGSGMGNSEADLKKLVPGADIKRGLAIHGSSAQETSSAIKKWLTAEKIL